MHKGEREKTGKAQIGKTEARKKEEKDSHLCKSAKQKNKTKTKTFYICVICRSVNV